MYLAFLFPFVLALPQAPRALHPLREYFILWRSYSTCRGRASREAADPGRASLEAADPFFPLEQNADILFVPAEILLEFDANIIFTRARCRSCSRSTRPAAPPLLSLRARGERRLISADLSEV